MVRLVQNLMFEFFFHYRQINLRLLAWRFSQVLLLIICLGLNGCALNKAANEIRAKDIKREKFSLGFPIKAPIQTHKVEQGATDVAKERKQWRWPKFSLPGFPALNRHYYEVQVGDTVSEIAADFRMSSDELARINGLTYPYSIYPKQRLRIAKLSPGEQPPIGTNDYRSVKNIKSNKKALVDEKQVYKRNGFSARKEETMKGQAKLYWCWPVKGELIQPFRPGHSKGVYISGIKGDPVVAAADGEVLYAGNDVVGYGNLVILQHSDGYLTTYAHNSRLLVGEGHRVKAGEKIAELGSSGTDEVKLHFEIRQQGNPVDPLQYLPSA